MFFALLAQIVSFLLDVVGLPCRSDHERDLDLLLLRQQLAILQRTQPRPARPSRWEKLVLAVLAAKLIRLLRWRPIPAERLSGPVHARHGPAVASRPSPAPLDVRSPGAPWPATHRP